MSGRRRRSPLGAFLLCAALLFPQPCAGTRKRTQDFMYNASLWWAPFYSGALHGELLSHLAARATEFVYYFVDIAKAGCFFSEVCPVKAECDREEIQEELLKLHDYFLHENVQVTRQLLEIAGGPDGDPDSPVGRLVRLSNALAQQLSDLRALPACLPLMEELANAENGRCTNLVPSDFPWCARAMSDVFRWIFPALHDAQIAAVVEAGEEERTKVVRLHISSDHYKVRPEIALTAPRPHSATFDEFARWGVDREEILTSLLRRVAGRPWAPQLPPEAVPADEWRWANASLRLTAAEVGVDDARTSEAMLSQVPELRLLLVDPWDNAADEYFEGVPSRRMEEARDAADNVWERMRPFRNRSVIIKQRSVDAAQLVAPGSLDLVFLDGCHAYDSVKEDMRAWLPKIRPGGVLAGHDYLLGHWPVIQATHELVRDEGIGPLYLGCDHMWWIWV